jgi:hypothetical protein
MVPCPVAALHPDLVRAGLKLRGVEKDYPVPIGIVFRIHYLLIHAHLQRKVIEAGSFIGNGDQRQAGLG